MKRIHVFGLILCAMLMSGVLLAMYVTSPLNKEMFRGKFNRNFEPDLILNTELKLNHKGYYVSGISDEKIYIGNYSTPTHLICYNLHNSDTERVVISGLEKRNVYQPMLFRTKIDSPYFFMYHGITPLVLRGNLGQWKAESFKSDTSDYFIDALSISKSSFAYKSFSKETKNYQLAKRMVIDTPHFKFQYGLLEGQKEGIFSVEGMMHFSKSLNKFIYIYRYRNEFFVADTSLSLLSRHKTIDPFDSVLVKADIIDATTKGATMMMSSPPTTVNNISCVSETSLYINSNILAANENKPKFESNSIVDVYDLNSGRYISSFYVPGSKKQKMLDMQVHDKYIICVFERSLKIYDRSAAAM